MLPKSKASKNELLRNLPTNLEAKLLVICAVVLLATIIQLLIPYDKRSDGNLSVPTKVFGGNPSIMFHACVLGLNFMFFGSLYALTLRNSYPKLSRCCLLVSVASMAMIAGIGAWWTLSEFFTELLDNVFAFAYNISEE